MSRRPKIAPMLPGADGTAAETVAPRSRRSSSPATRARRLPRTAQIAEAAARRRDGGGARPPRVPPILVAGNSRAQAAPDGADRRSRRAARMTRIAAAAARRFLVARHFLAPARSLPGGLDGVLEVFRKL